MWPTPQRRGRWHVLIGCVLWPTPHSISRSSRQDQSWAETSKRRTSNDEMRNSLDGGSIRAGSIRSNKSHTTTASEDDANSLRSLGTNSLSSSLGGRKNYGEQRSQSMRSLGSLGERREDYGDQGRSQSMKSSRLSSMMRSHPVPLQHFDLGPMRMQSLTSSLDGMDILARSRS